MQFIEIIDWRVIIYNLVSIPKSYQSLYMFIKLTNYGRHIVIILWQCFSWNTLVSVLSSPIIFYTRKYIFLFIDKIFISKSNHKILLSDIIKFFPYFYHHHSSWIIYSSSWSLKISTLIIPNPTSLSLLLNMTHRLFFIQHWYCIILQGKLKIGIHYYSNHYLQHMNSGDIYTK